MERIKEVLKIKKLPYTEIDTSCAISVVIPTYNEEKYLPNLLQDLVLQDFKHGFEVIVVDVSKDRTVEVAKEFKKKLNLTVTTKSEKGVSNQRNYGASIAKSKLLLFLDADTRLRKSALRYLWNFAIKQNYVAGSAWNSPDTKNLIDHLGMLIYNLYAILRAPISPVAPGAFMFVRKEVFDEIGGFRKEIKFAEDFDLTTRVKDAGYSFAYILLPLFKFSMRRVKQMGRFRYYLQTVWDGIVLMLPEKLVERLVIGYELEGHEE